MSFSLVTFNILLLIHNVVSIRELWAHPSTDVPLSCRFFFVEGTENLEFAWKRDDIKEEYEVEDDTEYYRFFRHYDFFEVFSKLVYQFSNNTKQLGEQNSLYEGRVSVDLEEISEGTLSLLLRNVDFMDEAVYKCSAITPNGRGQSTIKQIVEDSEMPQVQFDTIDDEDMATCVSKGWYLMPNVTWLDQAERDLSNHSTVEVLEEQTNGFYRVFSVLKYPVKLDEKYVCHTTETDVNNQPFRIIRKYPTHVSQTVHFQVLDKSPVLGPGRGPPSCNKWRLWRGLFFSETGILTTRGTQGPACLPMDQTQWLQLGPFCPWSPPDADNWPECPDREKVFPYI